MPKVIIRKNELPASASNGLYTFRVRMISDDKNSASNWTPIYNLIIPVEYGESHRVQDAVMANIYHAKLGTSAVQSFNVYVSWYDPNDLGMYDLYVKWRIGENWLEWTHAATVTSKNFMFNSPLHLLEIGQSFSMYGVAVTRSNFNKRYNPDFALFTTDDIKDKDGVIVGGISLV